MPPGAVLQWVRGETEMEPDGKSGPDLTSSSEAAQGNRLHLEAWQNTSSALAEWDALAVRRGNVFGSSEWALTWWNHWGAGRPLRVIACRRDSGELAAIFPLYLATRRPLRILRFIGHGAGDVLGPVHAHKDRAAVAAMLRNSLRENSERWDLLLGQQVPAGEGWSGALGAQVLRRERSPTLSLRWPTWDDYLASRSANFRQQIRRRPRQLARSHSVRFRLNVRSEQTASRPESPLRSPSRPLGHGCVAGSRAIASAFPPRLRRAGTGAWLAASLVSGGGR